MAQTQPEEHPVADASSRRKVELARAFAFHLLKAIKQIGMYRHNEARFPEFLQPCLDALAACHQESGALVVRLEQQNFFFLGQPLFAESSTLPYKFYRDGIRKLAFHPGISVDELVTFTLIALSEPERGADEVVAQLWKASLPHVEYVVVEGFKMEAYSEEAVQVEVDQVVNFLYARLSGSSDDLLRFARVSTEDLDVKLEAVEQLRGAVVSGVSASDELKARIQREIAEEEGARLFPKLVSAIFQVVENDVEDALQLEEMFIQILDALLLQEDIATINQIVLKLKALEQRTAPNEGLARLRHGLVARMGEEQRLMRLGEVLKLARPKNPQDIVRYLQALDPSTVPTLLTVLEGIELAESRLLLLDVLAWFAKQNPEPFLSRLVSERPQTVRDMVYALEKSGHPDRMKLFGRVLKHPSLAIRLEAMHIIARGRTGEARKLIAEALNAPSSQVRMLAARLLPDFDPERAFVDLVAATRDPSFERRPPEERAALYTAIGATGLPQALAMLNELIHAKPPLLNRKKVIDEKVLVVHGLAGLGSVQTLKILQALVEDRSQPAEVLAEARRALQQTRKALFGEGGTEEK